MMAFNLERWFQVLLGREFKAPCPNCGSYERATQLTGICKQMTEYCGNCHTYRCGYKHDGVFR